MGQASNVANERAKRTPMIFFIFNIFCKLILNLTLVFLTNTFACSYFSGAAKRLCRAMHGGARERDDVTTTEALTGDVAVSAAP